ncbi:sialin [Prorops nasuta]|uniref:sialin n=1 Tax=Prorops nasuta TaxID=863751 RepID=UPI0034CD15E9
MKRSSRINSQYKKELLSCRNILWCLVFCGFAVNYMLRINLNLTIVAMVMTRSKPTTTLQYEVLQNVTNSTIHLNHLTESTTNKLTVNFQLDEGNDRIYWSEYEQGLVLGAYYWLHWLFQIPGGLLARKYGTKFVFGWANFLTAIIGFFIPVAARYHIHFLIALRSLQGLIAGSAWPSMHDMTAKWIPQFERSRFVSAYLGSSIGAAFTYPLCAIISDSIGWAYAFYITSGIGVIWYCFWVILVYDTPQEHPRISDGEKNYILENLSNSINEETTQVPWKAILTSRPVWATIAAHWGSAWGFLTLMTQSPTYFRFIHGWQLNATGFLSGIPHLLRMIFSYGFSLMCDWLLQTNKVKLKNVRKLATFVCCAVQGVFILALGYSGGQPIIAAVLMLMGIAFNGAISASTLANFVDLSPNYASVLLGLGGLIAINGSYISPLIVGILTNNNQTVSSWKIVYIIAAINSIGGFVVYQIFGSSREQPWNSYEKRVEVENQELQVLNISSSNSNDTNNIREKQIPIMKTDRTE